MPRLDRLGPAHARAASARCSSRAPGPSPRSPREPPRCPARICRSSSARGDAEPRFDVGQELHRAAAGRDRPAELGTPLRAREWRRTRRRRRDRSRPAWPPRAARLRSSDEATGLECERCQHTGHSRCSAVIESLRSSTPRSARPRVARERSSSSLVSLGSARRAWRATSRARRVRVARRSRGDVRGRQVALQRTGRGSR